MKQISIREQDEFIKLGQALKKANLCLLYTSPSPRDCS